MSVQFSIFIISENSISSKTIINIFFTCQPCNSAYDLKVKLSSLLLVIFLQKKLTLQYFSLLEPD